MPKGDRTGPTGQGPATGRALGFCSGFDAPGYSKGFGNGTGRGSGFGGGSGYGFGRGRGIGFGTGRGRGMGYGRGRNITWSHTGPFHEDPWSHPMSKEDEIRMLKAQAKTLKQTQQQLEKRLHELEKGNEQ